MFDEVLKIGNPEISKVLTKVHNGYIEVVQKLIGKLNAKTTELDTLTTSKQFLVYK